MGCHDLFDVFEIAYASICLQLWGIVMILAHDIVSKSRNFEIEQVGKQGSELVRIIIIVAVLREINFLSLQFPSGRFSCT